MRGLARTVTVAITATFFALSLAACGGGGGGGGGDGTASPPGGGGNNPTPSPTPQPNRAPVAANDVIRADDSALDALKVADNDSDPDGNALTVTIEQDPVIGTATVNPDKTIKLASLPSGFKGVTWFKYRITDPSGLFATATAAIFVGTDPFRVAFAADAGNGANEIYLASFTSDPTAVTGATEGSMRLAGFQASDNGATIVYRRASTSTPTTADLSFVQTATASQQVRIALPAGTTLPQSVADANLYRVSPDGKWIAFVADDTAGARSAYVLNAATPTTITKVGPTTAVYAAQLRFSRNSQTLYGLFADVGGGSNKTLWSVDLGSLTPTQLSASSATGLNDITDYQVGADQHYFQVRRKRSGLDELDYVESSALTTEKLIYQAPALTTITYSTLERPAGLGASVLADKIAYVTTLSNANSSFYVRLTDQPPSPQPVGASGSRVIGFRPNDENGLLYARSGQIYEKSIAPTPPADAVIGAGNNAWYDSTGNIILLEQALPNKALAVVTRANLGSPQTLGTPGATATFYDTSGFDRGVVILGEQGTSNATARLALVNALAPDKLFYFVASQSPFPTNTGSGQFGTSPAQVVSQ